MNVWAFARRVGMDVCKPQLTFPTCTQASTVRTPDATRVHSLLNIFTHVSCELRLIAMTDQLDVERSPLKQSFLTTLNLQVEVKPVLPVAPKQQMYGCFSYLVQLHFLNCYYILNVVLGHTHQTERLCFEQANRSDASTGRPAVERYDTACGTSNRTSSDSRLQRNAIATPTGVLA